MSKNKSSNLRSVCCKAKVTPGNNIWICTKCKNECTMMLNTRKTWAINPKTRIVPNKKRALSDKEIKEILRNEDF